MNKYAAEVYNKLSQEYYWEKEFLSSVKEIFQSISLLLDKHESMYRRSKILENIVNPDRIISFRVPWEDDHGTLQVNTGWRVEFNNVLGPYKGGLRFHVSTNQSTLKFLGFEQTFKNALTGLSMGGGKGGSDFSPKGKSDNEIKKFCQSFMLELSRYIGARIDIPAGDIGVGGREIGYLYGFYRKLGKSFDGAITGKGVAWGGSILRQEATGYGVIYFLNEMLEKQEDSLEGKKIAISGFGNVAWGVVKKVNELGGKVVTLSGPDGFVHDADGVSGEKVDYMQQMRFGNRDCIEDYSLKYNKAKFYRDKKPWGIECDIAIPCAIQNEVDADDIRQLLANGVKYIVEGANQPLTEDAVNRLIKTDVLYTPGKASNAGGVACSYFEMAQNASFSKWGKDEVDTKLKRVMKFIHEQCCHDSLELTGKINYLIGANIAGFKRVADAMIDQGMI